MQLSAKLIELLPLQTGTGKNGTWKKQDIIVETDGQYPKKVCISVWGDKADESVLQIGNQLKIDFDIESREYNGRWYTDVKAWKIEAEGNSRTSSSNSSYGNANNYNSPPEFAPFTEKDIPAEINVDNDDLPF
jgi:hypothetical protein